MEQLPISQIELIYILGLGAFIWFVYSLRKSDTDKYDTQYLIMAGQVNQLADRLAILEFKCNQIAGIETTVGKLDTLTNALYRRDRREMGPQTLVTFSLTDQLNYYLITEKRLDLSEIKDAAHIMGFEGYDNLKLGDAARKLINDATNQHQTRDLAHYLGEVRDDLKFLM